MNMNPRFDFRELRRRRVADRCVCCGSDVLESAPAIMMPFVAHRTFGWAPARIDESWGLQTVACGMAYTVCRSMSCTDCGLLFCDLRFTDDELARLYEDYRGEDYTALRETYEPGYTLRNEALSRQIDYGGALERFLDPLLPRGPLAILDWGGDTGKNTPLRERARRHDVYDISNATVIAGARAVTLEEAMRQRYDLVVCSNVLEHVPYPSDVLEHARRAMTADSLLYVEVPFEDVIVRHGKAGLAHKKHWHEHVNFFSPASLQALLANVGLVVVALDTDSAITAGLKTSRMMQAACRLA